MFKKIVFTFAALAAVCAVAPTALAGTPSPTLDGEQLAAAADGVQTRCSIGLLGVALSHAASGTATGAYSGTFAESGTGRLSMGSLVAFDASFTLATPTGTLKGTMQRVNGRASGSGTCDGTKEDATVDATGIVYTLTLPDGTIDQGIVDLSFSDVPTSAHFAAAFHSTSRVADADLDGVLDGRDNCPVDRNGDQADTDLDGAGDACDLVDDRPAYFDDLVASSKAAAIPNALVTRAEHARTAYFKGDKAGACTDLAAYVDGVTARRGRTIPAATADALVVKAQKIRIVVPCR